MGQNVYKTSKTVNDPFFFHQGKNFKRGQSCLIGFVVANTLLNLFNGTNLR